MVKLPKVALGLILPLWFGVAAVGAPRPRQEKKPDDNRPAQQDSRPQEQPKPENRPRSRTQPQPKPQEQPRQEPAARSQEQPKPENRPQPRTQPQPKPQEQPRQQPDARQQEQPKPENRPQPHAKEQPRTQPQPKPQEQPRQQPTARSQEQPKPNENRPPSNSNAGRRVQARPSQPNENRGGEGGRNSGGSRPQQNSQQQAHSYAAAKRVPQAQKRTIFQQHRASNWGADHRDWRSRGGYLGLRIPEARFGLYFGRAHYFHLWDLPMVYVGGYPEFQYHGYWFELLDPVPPDWDPDWYQTDQVYIDWDPDYGGYYLYDTSHPDERLAVEIAG